MKFDFEAPGGIDVEHDFEGLKEQNPDAKRMPDGCHCHGGKLTASCLNCAVRFRARTKLAGLEGNPMDVIDVVDESGFCTSCNEVKPLRGSRTAASNSDPLAEEHRHMTCEDCLSAERADVG